jgi:hypothetical protein
VAREQVPGFEPAASPAEAPAAEQADGPTSPRKGLDPHGGLKGRRKSRKDKLREALAAPGEPAR